MTTFSEMQHTHAAKSHVFAVESLPPGDQLEAAMSQSLQPIGSSLSALYRYSSNATAPLRIGVIVDSLVMPACLNRILQDIVRSNFARVECAVIPRLKATDLTQGANRAAASHAKVMLRLYVSLMAGRSASIKANSAGSQAVLLAANPLKEVDASELICGAQIFTTDDVAAAECTIAEAINRYNLDVLLMLGSTPVPLREDLLPRYGMWSLRLGARTAAEAEPPLLRELMERKPVSEVALEVLHADYSGPMVLDSMVFGTDFGLAQGNQFGPRWGSTHLVIRKLHELHQRGWRAISASLTSARISGSKPLTNRKVASWLASELLKRARSRIRRAPQQKFVWHVGMRRTDRPLCIDHSVEALRQFKLVTPTPGSFWADPFLFERSGDTWIFVEEYNYSLKRGQIACGRIDPDGTVVDSRVCLDTPYHLSYPHIFEHGGDVFMVPESSANETVDLYRAVNFPYEWRHERALLRMRGVDATMLHREGLWWLFVTAADVPGHPVPTLLFTASALDGKWTLHPASPICSDIRTARGAGAIFTCGASLIRPSQDCSLMYGRQLKLNEIVTMDAERYSERERVVIAPDWMSGIVGVHTYNRAGAWEVLDVRLRQ